MSGTNTLPLAPVDRPQYAPALVDDRCRARTSSPLPRRSPPASSSTCPGPGASAFAVAAANVGAPVHQVTANKGACRSRDVCQTGPGGACLNGGPRQRDGVHRAGQHPDLLLLRAGEGFVPFDPANNRIFPIFTTPRRAISSARPAWPCGRSRMNTWQSRSLDAHSGSEHDHGRHADPGSRAWPAWIRLGRKEGGPMAGPPLAGGRQLRLQLRGLVGRECRSGHQRAEVRPRAAVSRPAWLSTGRV